jgi:hypothetical protein
VDFCVFAFEEAEFTEICFFKTKTAGNSREVPVFLCDPENMQNPGKFSVVFFSGIWFLFDP